LLASVIVLMRSVLIRDQFALSQCIEIRDFMGIRQLTHAQLPSLKILGFDAPAQVFEVFESVALMSDWQACERMLPLSTAPAAAVATSTQAAMLKPSAQA
jgi:hypothetical protein